MNPSQAGVGVITVTLQCPAVAASRFNFVFCAYLFALKCVYFVSSANMQMWRCKATIMEHM